MQTRVREISEIFYQTFQYNQLEAFRNEQTFQMDYHAISYKSSSSTFYSRVTTFLHCDFNCRRIVVVSIHSVALKRHIDNQTMNRMNETAKKKKKMKEEKNQNDKKAAATLQYC